MLTVLPALVAHAAYPLDGDDRLRDLVLAHLPLPFFPPLGFGKEGEASSSCPASSRLLASVLLLLITTVMYRCVLPRRGAVHRSRWG
jgi:hypothetical protein